MFVNENRKSVGSSFFFIFSSVLLASRRHETASVKVRISLLIESENSHPSKAPSPSHNLQLTTHNKQEQKVPIHIIFTTIKAQSCSARRPFHSNKMMSISSIHRPMLLATSSSESSSEPPAKKREWTTVSICLDERTNNDEYLVGVK
jgi:hypothetical protein